jgi:hypothetical protein
MCCFVLFWFTHDLSPFSLLLKSLKWLGLWAALPIMISDMENGRVGFFFSHFSLKKTDVDSGREMETAEVSAAISIPPSHSHGEHELAVEDGGFDPNFIRSVGLSSEEAKELLLRHGRNELEEKRTSKIMLYLYQASGWRRNVRIQEASESGERRRNP